MKKIGIFGGAFNPPHIFHFNVAKEILDNFNEFEKIIFVPVGDKYKKIDLISAEHRYNMLKKACEGNDKLEVSRLEIEENEQLYAYQTLDKFSIIYPNHKLYFVIGTDSLKTLDTWANLDYLLTNYSFLVYKRGDDDFYEILESLPQIHKYKNSINYANNMVYSNLSSSYIREAIKNNKDIKGLVSNTVFNYIQENNLYK